MLTVVLILNLLIAGLCWYVAWRLWQLRRAFARAADALILAERSTDRVLHYAPEFLLQGQVGADQLRHQYQQVLLRLQRVQQILSLLGLGQLIWRQYASQFVHNRLNRDGSHPTTARMRRGLTKRHSRKQKAMDL